MKRMKLFIPCSFHTELDTLTKCGAVIKVTQNTFDEMWSQVCHRRELKVCSNSAVGTYSYLSPSNVV